MRLVSSVLTAASIASAVAAQAQMNPAFAPCAACHKVEKGKNGLGPSLYKIIGRKKASVPGFSYSDAMKAKGGVWSESELDVYLTNPRAFVPGTRMSYPGMKDPAKRAAVIAYLKSVK